MPEEGESLMRALCDVFNRREGEAGVQPLVDPAVTLQDYPGLPDAGWHYGHEGVLEWAAKLISVSSDIRIEPSDFRQVGDRFYYEWQVSGRGTMSGIPAGGTGFGVGTIREGKLYRLELYTNREDALEAAGLRG
jgi:hypothetical protein